MNTTTAPTTTNFLSLGEVIQHDGYTLQDAGTIKLGKTTFSVQLQKNDGYDEIITWLNGPRGAAYTLEPVSHIKDTGVFSVMSFKSGSFLRVQGNEVRVVMLGTVIEVA